MCINKQAISWSFVRGNYLIIILKLSFGYIAEKKCALSTDD